MLMGCLSRVWLIVITALCILSSCVSTQPKLVKDKASSFEINNEFIRKYLTALKNPRILTVDDVTDKDEREAFAEYGYSFVAEGDLNKDGFRDYAVVGKYDGPYPDQLLFIAILSVKDGTVSLDFLHKLRFPHDRAFLKIEPWSRFRCKGSDSRFDVLFVAMKLWTEYAWIIAWDGKRYFVIDQCWYLPEEESGSPLELPL